jgi:hypothetical protein
MSSIGVFWQPGDAPLPVCKADRCCYTVCTVGIGCGPPLPSDEAPRTGRHEEVGRGPVLPESMHVPREFGGWAVFDPRVATRHFSTPLDCAPKILALWLVSDQEVQEAGKELAQATLCPSLIPLLEAGKGGAQRVEMEKEWATVAEAAWGGSHLESHWGASPQR